MLGGLGGEREARHERRHPAGKQRGMTVGQACAVVSGLLLLAVAIIVLRSWGSSAPVASPAHVIAVAAKTGEAGADPVLSDEKLKALRSAAAVLDPELMKDVPGQYNASMLNPCWQSEAAGKLRCLPYFYVSGFHTGAGTLAKRLTAYPHVLLDAGKLSGWGPTWGFWSEYRNTLNGYMDGIQEHVPAMVADPMHNVVMDGSMSTFALYWAASGKAHRAFSTTAVSCWKECDRQYTSAGPQYEQCMDEKCLPSGREADEKAALNASLLYSDLQLPLLMRALYGHRTPKFVLLLRDPVDRMYSAYWGTQGMVSRYGNSSEGFTKFVEEQVSAYRACVEAHSEEACIMRFETLSMKEEKVFFHCDQIFRGMYARYLRVWLRYFPRAAFLVLKSEEYFQDPQEGMKQVLRFLELPVPEPSSPTWAAMQAAGPAVSNIQGKPQIPEGARRALGQLYEGHNRELAGMLGDSKWTTWNANLEG